MNLEGKKFGRLTVLEQADVPEYVKNKSARYWKCLCACGNEKIVAQGHLVAGRILSCGCLTRERTAESNRILKRKNNTYDMDSYDYDVCYFSNAADKYFIFDKEDYEKIQSFCWRLNQYPIAHLQPGKIIYLHKLIMGNSSSVVDHINGNVLDARKCNLRLATQQENSMNTKIHSNNTSGVSGVTYNKRSKQWVARIGYKMKRIFLGSFNTKEEAINARKEAEQKYYGEFSYDNSQKFIQEIGEI